MDDKHTRRTTQMSTTENTNGDDAESGDDLVPVGEQEGDR